MILIGLINENSSTGSGEDNYSVTHQRTDVIAGSPTDTAESLAELYHAMVHKAEQSRKALIDLEDRLDAEAFSDSCSIGADEYDDLCGKYRADMRILKYDKILIVEGIILK
jgi:hypothetical protein